MNTLMFPDCPGFLGREGTPIVCARVFVHLGHGECSVIRKEYHSEHVVWHDCVPLREESLAALRVARSSV